MRGFSQSVSAALLVLAVGCGQEMSDEERSGSKAAEVMDTRNLELGLSQRVPEQAAFHVPGELLFRYATFGGNGRTCETCHGLETGTLNPAEIQARFAANPNDPLFRPIDSDDGTGQRYNRLLTRGTILVKVPLAPNVKLEADPTATHIVLERGIPSTINAPAFDSVLMFDGREPDLESQALSAVLSHAEPDRLPQPIHLKMIASYEREQFSSDILRQYAKGGPAPTLPPGNTEAQIRGRKFFEPGGLCAACHSGPMLNEVPVGNVLKLRPGLQFARPAVSDVNVSQRPVHRFRVTLPNGTVRTLFSPDPGRMLITGVLSDFNTHKINSLWNVNKTAPYFHDNSAPTLEAVMVQYQRFFQMIGLSFTPEQQSDVVEYMQLL